MKALISDAKKFRENRATMQGKLLFVFSTQIAVCVLLAIDLIKSDDIVFYCYPSVRVVLTRFICGAYLHSMFLQSIS